MLSKMPSIYFGAFMCGVMSVQVFALPQMESRWMPEPHPALRDIVSTSLVGASLPDALAADIGPNDVRMLLLLVGDSARAKSCGGCSISLDDLPATLEALPPELRDRVGIVDGDLDSVTAALMQADLGFQVYGRGPVSAWLEHGLGNQSPALIAVEGGTVTGVWRPRQPVDDQITNLLGGS